MRKKKQHYSVSVNSYEETYYKKTNVIERYYAPKYNKLQSSIAYLNTKTFIYSQIQISRNVPDENIEEAIFNKTYDELALDETIEFKIQAIESFDHIDGDYRNYDVFVVNTNELDETFKQTLKSIKYIDLIIPAPLLLKILYTKDIIEHSGVHCFVYIQEYSSFLVFYKDKEFLYSKTINISLQELHEKYCKDFNEKIDYEEFKHFIQNEDFKTSTNEKVQNIIKLYTDALKSLNELIMFARRSNELEKVDRIYIGSSFGFRSNIHELAEVALGIKGYNFNFDYGFVTTEKYIDQLHYLMQLYIELPEYERPYKIDFSKYKSPPAFIKRDSGKIITIGILGLIGSMIYPSYYWSMAYKNNIELKKLKKEYKKVHHQKNTIETLIDQKQKQLKKTVVLLEKERDIFKEKKKTILKIKEVKNNYLMKAKTLTEFTKNLNKYGVKISQTSYSENNNTKQFKFDLVSKESSKITNLLEYITEKHPNEFKFRLDDIEYKKEEGLYFGTLKAIVK